MEGDAATSAVLSSRAGQGDTVTPGSSGLGARTPSSVLCLPAGPGQRGSEAGPPCPRSPSSPGAPGWRRPPAATAAARPERRKVGHGPLPLQPGNNGVGARPGPHPRPGDSRRQQGTAGEVKGEIGEEMRGHKETGGDVVKGCEGGQGEMTRGDDTGR